MSDEFEERMKRIEASLERTKASLEQTKAMQEGGQAMWDKTQQSIDEGLRQLKGMQGERIFYRRIMDNAVDRCIKVYPGLLSDEQKQQLEAAEELLFDLSNDVVEETTRRIKIPPFEKQISKRLHDEKEEDGSIS
jgi:hypothetical protein